MTNKCFLSDDICEKISDLKVLIEDYLEDDVFCKGCEARYMGYASEWDDETAGRPVLKCPSDLCPGASECIHKVQYRILYEFLGILDTLYRYFEKVSEVAE